MNIQAGYSHDPCCPRPLYRGSEHDQAMWRLDYARNKYRAQKAEAEASLTPCSKTLIKAINQSKKGI